MQVTAITIAIPVTTTTTILGAGRSIIVVGNIRGRTGPATRGNAGDFSFDIIVFFATKPLMC